MTCIVKRGCISNLITLYYAPHTRSDRALWILQELGIDYELKLMNLKSGDHKKPDYLNINPYGLVPALEDDTISIYESVAICMYLADRYGNDTMAPTHSDIQRGVYYQTCIRLVSSIEPPFVRLLNALWKNPDCNLESDFPDEYNKIKQNLIIFSNQLDDSPYILGDHFSTADIVNGGCLLLGRAFDMLFDAPKNILDYLDRLEKRTAYKKMREIEKKAAGS